MTDRPFAGAKLMLFAGPDLVALERDFAPGLVWPGMLDFPGGAREGTESPTDCALRETHEELGLRLDPAQLRLAHLRDVNGRRNWFFAAHLPARVTQDVVFGGEGAGWRVMPPRDFVGHPGAIPHFRAILRAWLDRSGWVHA